MAYVKLVRRKPSALLLCITVILTLISCAVGVHGQEKRASVQGVSGANLRSGPGLSHPPKAILAENDQLTIEGKEGDWYLVTTADGQMGYVYQSLVKISGDERTLTPPREAMAEKTAVTETKAPQLSLTAEPPTPTEAPPKTDSEPASTKKPSDASSPTATASPPQSIVESNASKTPQAKSPPLIHLLEGRESDVILWLAIAVAFFLIGWIFGGNYYLRRDRARRTKLRF